MEPNVERRSEDSDRHPVNITVEVGHGGALEDSFEADALNLSRGGVSMRAACLPDVGARLCCRFEAAPGGASVVASGEVVWAQLCDEYGGEFGVRFLDLSAGDELLLGEILAECGTLVPAEEGSGPPPAPVVQLALDGITEPITAHLTRDEDGRVTFEQQLDLLSLGRGVQAAVVGEAERRGAITGVELRLVGNVPTLAVTVAFGDEADFGEYEFEASNAGALLHDTEPDFDAPAEPEIAPGADAAASVTTMNEFDSARPPQARSHTRQEAAYPHDDEPLPSALATPLPVTAPGDMRAVLEAAGDLAVDAQASERPDGDDWQEPDAQYGASASHAALPVDADPDLDFATGDHEPSAGALSAAGEEEAALAHPPRAPALDTEALDDPFAPRPVIAPWLRALATLSGTALGRASVAAGALLAWLAPRARGGAIQARRTVGELAGKRVLPFFGAARRMLMTHVLRRRRRTTGGAHAQRQRSPGGSGWLRGLLLGALGAGAMTLAVYALAPADEGEVQLHRPVQPLPPPNSAPTETPAALAPPGAAVRSLEPVVVPAPQTVPSGSPFAVDVREAKVGTTKPAAPVASPTGVGSRVFGHTQAPKGKHFTLRMSAPVKELRGVKDAGGFTVIVPGALSLDRAGPIASTHRGVSRSMILNKGSHSELTIRFADGKQPAYQVKGVGNAIEITIEGS